MAVDTETLDPKGNSIKGSKVVEIIQHAGENSGVRYEGRDLLPFNGPHRVPAGFALELIAGNRAVEYDADNPRNKPKKSKGSEVQNGDPSTQTGDPDAQNGDPKTGKGKK